MKTLRLLLAVLLAAPASTIFAAYQPYPVRNRIVYVDDGRTSSSVQIARTDFRVEILTDGDETKAEDLRNGRPFITAQPGETYSVRLFNPLPVRVAVNLTVDGLNSISGKPTGIADGQKWMIDPNSSITIRGWQVNGGEARRFFFTRKPKSYARWMGKKLDKDLAVNCGVIGAAFFWSQQELDDYYAANPIYRMTRYTPPPAPTTSGAAPAGAFKDGESIGSDDNMSQLKVRSASIPRRMDEPAAEMQRAGTGMGERESHPTESVEFHFDTGMYTLATAVVIYYDFARPTPVPNPFPEASYSPEM